MARIIAYYDNECSLCIKIQTKLKKLDHNQNIDFIGIRNNAFLPFSEELMSKEMYVYNEQNHHFSTGINAIYELTLAIPSLRILSAFIKLSIIFGFGKWLYKLIAKNRRMIPVNNCNNDSCKIGK